MPSTFLNTEKLNTVLQPKIPKNALDYCVSLWVEHPFSFKISNTRSSCLGNYKFERGQHSISINHDLNQYNFLITYLHEVAHQRVFIQFPPKGRKRTLPHGLEWKNTFIELMIPVLNENVFPLEILKPLLQHMKNPAASSTRDANLMRALKQFDPNPTFKHYLGDLPIGETFIFKKRKFRKLEKRRTRALCQEIFSGQKYTIPLMADIIPLESN